VVIRLLLVAVMLGLSIGYLVRAVNISL